MQPRAFVIFAGLAVLACGSGRPDVGGLTSESDEDAAVGGAGGRSDAAPAIRLLTDVASPGEAVGRGAGGGGERDASLRETGTVRDGPSEREVDQASIDAPSEAVRDVAAEARNDASNDTIHTARDAPVAGDPSIDVSIDAAVSDAAIADANDDDNDSTVATADHLLISEVVTRPSGAEFIEIVNPTRSLVSLSDYLVSDSQLYYRVATGTFTTASGSDFAARFPEGFALEPGGFAVIALGNASGGSSSFQAVYAKKPDFELRPTANGADDDPEVPNMQSAQPSSSIGATASLTDGGEPVMLFVYRSGDLVSDVDYLFFGVPSASNPVVDKTGVMVGASSYLNDSSGPAQRPVLAPGDGGSLHRCIYAESEEKRTTGNGVTGHDETSENGAMAFTLSSSANERTPGGPPPARLCGP